MGIRQRTALGVHGKFASRGRALVGDKGAALALGAEAQAFQGQQRGNGEAVIDFRHVYIRVRQPGALERQFTRNRRRRLGEVRHLADHAVAMCLARAQHPYGRLFQIPGPLQRGQDNRAARIRHQTAIQQVQGRGDDAGVHYIVDGDGIAHAGLGVQAGPFARRHGNFRQLFRGCAVFVHMALGGEGIGAYGGDAIGLLELGWTKDLGRLGYRSTPSPTIRDVRATMANQRHVAQPGRNGHGRMLHIDHEGGTADGR